MRIVFKLCVHGKAQLKQQNFVTLLASFFKNRNRKGILIHLIKLD